MIAQTLIPFGDLSRETVAISEQIHSAISNTLAGGRFILGERVRRFESEFAAYCGASFAVGLGSGTEALHLGLLALGVKPGDEVITVANTCVPTVSAITFAQATPVLIDCDPTSYNINPELLESAITSKTRAIIPVHLYGQAANMDTILSIADQHGIAVLEDCAQAHGTMYKGRHVGTFGHCGAFSFYPSKNLGAYGDAGALVTNDGDIAQRVTMLRNYGQHKRYYHRVKGYNSRLDELQAAILSAKLQFLDEWNNRRRAIARYYRTFITHPLVRLPTEMPYGKHVYHIFPLRSFQRNKLQEHLWRSNIETLIHYPVPIHLQESYSELGKRAGSYPHSEDHANEELSLPIFPSLSDEEVERVTDAINSFDERVHYV